MAHLTTTGQPYQQRRWHRRSIFGSLHSSLCRLVNHMKALIIPFGVNLQIFALVEYWPLLLRGRLQLMDWGVVV